MAERMARIDTFEHHGEPVIAIQGDVDIGNVDEIGKQIEHAIDQHTGRCIVDLTLTTYLDSSGIRLLFALASRLGARRRQLHLIVPEDGITRRVLEVTDVPTVIPVASSLDHLES
jgi:anti-anti-sigma factor